jgi:hypothetical protein
MHTGTFAAGAIAIGVALSAFAPAGAQTVVANVPAPGLDLRAEADAFEAARNPLGAARALERALEREPNDAQLHWRIARNLIRHAERDPQLDAALRAELYERAKELARAGRELEPSCAECCLYEFAGTASLARLRGVVRAAGTVREAGRLLEQCLADPPEWRDASGSEEASLYYGASVFYRRMPDSEWMAWATGQRSDSARSVDLARRAVALEGNRVRYRLELGAALLCDGARSGDEARIEEGRRWTADAATGRGPDAERARALAVQAPERGCELSLDDVLEAF